MLCKNTIHFGYLKQNNQMGDAFTTAITLIVGFDNDLLDIVWRSLVVSLTAVAIASVVGISLGAILAIREFPGRRALIYSINAFMGLPPVVVGLGLYLILSRAGPLGVLGLLFTPYAMILAQAILVLPIITAISFETLQTMWKEYRDQLLSFAIPERRIVSTLIWEARFGLMVAVLAGFGRASAEVGAVMIVGGNIDHATRVMTTTIALETAKGNLELAMALGIILLGLTFAVAILMQWINNRSARWQGDSV